MRLLMVVDVFPDPPVHGSAVISYHWSRLLSRRHDVELVSVDPPGAEGAAFFERSGVGDPGIPVPRRSRVAQIAGLLAGYPPSVSAVDAPRLLDLIERSGAGHYDAAIVVGPSLLRVAEALQNRMKVIYVPYDAVSRVLSSRGGDWHDTVDRLRWPVESRLWRRLERNRFRALDGVVVVAETDRGVIGGGWSAVERARLHVVTNGVDAGYFHPADEGNAAEGLVFTGNLWTYDSVAGARWFIERVLPRVRAEEPGTGLRIVGRDPQPALMELAAAADGVEVIPNVPDIRPHIADAAVYVCPLISGSGVKNRVLEAMAMAKATVMTSECSVPLGLDRSVARTADTPPDFAAELIALLRSPSERRALGAAARRMVVDRFSWEAAVARVETILDEL